MIASIGLATAGAIALVAAPELTHLVFERGAFKGDDTRSVALLVRLMAIGFIAESISLVSSKPFSPRSVLIWRSAGDREGGCFN